MDTLEQDAILTPETAEEDSPYLRRQKPVQVRRNRFSGRLRGTLFALAVLLPVCGMGIGVAYFAQNSPYFVLDSADEVVVLGNHYVSREEVLGALGIPLTGRLRNGTNVFHLSLDAVRKGVETLPWVHTAAVTRILPHGLLVHIVERKPVAYANVAGRIILVDDEGMLLEKPDSGVFDFPILYGLEDLPSSEDRRSRMALYREFMKELGTEAPRQGWMISEVYLGDSEDLKALMVNGQQSLQVHFGQKDFLSRFQNFLALYPEILKSNDKLDSVDLRYHNQVVVEPPDDSTSADPAKTRSN